MFYYVCGNCLVWAFRGTSCIAWGYLFDWFASWLVLDVWFVVIAFVLFVNVWLFRFPDLVLGVWLWVGYWFGLRFKCVCNCFVCFCFVFDFGLLCRGFDLVCFIWFCVVWFMIVNSVGTFIYFLMLSCSYIELGGYLLFAWLVVCCLRLFGGAVLIGLWVCVFCFAILAILVWFWMMFWISLKDGLVVLVIWVTWCFILFLVL